MPPQRARSSARLLAPAALALFVVAVLAIVLGSAGDGGDSEREATTPGRTATTGPAPTPGRRRARSTYTVKRGDTLGAIAEKTGVEVETLQELNPRLDPQALVAGQRIKLRE